MFFLIHNVPLQNIMFPILLSSSHNSDSSLWTRHHAVYELNLFSFPKSTEEGTLISFILYFWGVYDSCGGGLGQI